MNVFNFRELDRLDKRAARKAFNSGAEIMVIPCKCNPENAFINFGVWVSKNEMSDDYDFDQFVNAFEFYNCNPETGRYASYYARKAG